MGEPGTSRSGRAIAVVGLGWIPIVGLLILTNPGVHAAWKWAAVAYGVYGVLECLATLSDNRDDWARWLKVARVVSLTVLAVAFVYLIVTAG